MASSGRMTGNTVSYSNYFFVDWQLASQNVAGNYSTINWQAYWHFQGNDRQLDNGYVDGGGARQWTNGGRIYNYTGNFSTRDLNIASGSFNIGHYNDGTRDMYIGGGCVGYSGENSSGNAGWWLPQIPRHSTMTGANDFNDEANPYFTYSNPANAAVDFYIETPYNGAGALAARSLGTGGGGGYTVTLTTTERNALRARMPNSNTMTVRYVIHDTVGGDGWSYIDRTMSIVNGNPVFTDSQVSYQDTNAAAVAITTNNQHIVQSISTIRAAFTAATAQKSATMSSYKVTLGTDVRTFSTAQTAIDYVAQNVAVDTPLTVEATDSRGNKTTATKTVTFLPWSTPRAALTIGRVNNYEDTTNLTAAVTIDSVNSKNAILSIELKYKKTSDSTWTTTTMTNNVLKTITLDKLFEWNIQIIITDKFGSTTYNTIVQKGIPILFFDTEKLSIGVGMFPTTDEALEIEDTYLIPIMKKVHPVGRIVMSTSSTNPGTLPELAGTTWTAWGTGRVPVGVDTGQTEFDTVGETGGAKTHTLTVDQIPAHSHGLIQGSGGSGNYTYPANSTYGVNAFTNNAGGGQAHNNLQPYITCYFWKRTA